VPATDLTLQITELRTLGKDFEAFHLRLNALEYQPGADAHEQISPLLLESQQLTARTLQQLTALTNGPYTQLPGSRYGLESLSAVVAGTALASADLACALSDNPYEGTNFAGSPPMEEAAVRRARHQEAAPLMAKRVADAVYQFDVAATACHYLASGAAKRIEEARAAAQQERKKAPEHLSSRQFDALRALALGGGQRWSSLRPTGTIRIITQDRTRVTNATFESLLDRRLVTYDNPNLMNGQAITVTAEGHRALAHHAFSSPATAVSPARAVAPSRCVRR
jgi:hypothetical protein